jgi:protein subunit release factor A
MSTSRKTAVIVEIRAAEGGDDAKAIVDEQLAIYMRRAARAPKGRL